jgi:hypothetical protein
VRLLRKLGAFALFTLFAALPAHASFVWNEIGAGSLPASAEETVGSGELTQINGQLVYDGDAAAWAVDLYQIKVVNPAAFSARTIVVDGTNMSDPALYLFDAAGSGVYMNNDNGLIDFQATLPAGNPFGPVSSGRYYLAIAWGFSDALSFDSIFSLDQFLDPTGVYGPTGPGGAAPLAAWNPAGPGNFDLPSAYTINFTSAAAAPEPGTLALLLVAAAGAFARRRRLH